MYFTTVIGCPGAGVSPMTVIGVPEIPSCSIRATLALIAAS